VEESERIGFYSIAINVLLAGIMCGLAVLWYGGRPAPEQYGGILAFIPIVYFIGSPKRPRGRQISNYNHGGKEVESQRLPFQRITWKET